ncbi:cytochrome P450 [Allokutzneria sp. NRRL B-24872]|uniref:cytochrome P450 n=1 Tax=Allokutzneria sp. NRRL B-24872 TaxID=1137961 RepID=UPI001AEF4463|nr:cytochrome P450 [Allokutzneria sp. NRRL B-24872]
MSETVIAVPRTRKCPFSPPPGLAEVRDRAPVTRATFPSGDEAWLITGYAEVRAAMRDPRFSVLVPRALHTKDGVVTAKPGRGSLLWQDAPEHTTDRKLLAKEFTVRRMQALRPNIQRIVDEHLDEMERLGPPADLVSSFAVPVPSMVISDLFGVPVEQRPEFQEIAEAVMGVNPDPEVAQAAGMRLGGMLFQMVQERRANPGEDLISALIGTDDPDGVIDDMFLITAAGTLLIAAHDTTACMIGLGSALLLDRPEQFALLRNDPSLVGTAVEEMLRFLTIGQYGGERIATEDVEIGGVLIRKGEQVVVHALAADFDPALVVDPETFDITRRPSAHLAFGFGPHQCIGQQLARIELQIVFETLVRRFPELRLAVPAEELSFRDEMVFYGVHKLPVTW